MQAKFHYLQKQAHDMVSLAIAHEDLIPLLVCEECGGNNNGIQLDTHHEDYSKPLEVTWLCRSCHAHYTNIGVRKIPRKMIAALEWLRAHPEHVDVESRKLGEMIGVSHTLANEARKIVKSELEE